VRQIFPAGAGAPDIGPVPPGGPRRDAGPAVTALGALYAYPAAAGVAPWLRASMVASVDGAASLGGRSGGLSGDADRLVFSVLRSLADVILVGAGTARAEGYRPVRPGEVWAALREGRAPVPPIAVVTGKLDLNDQAPLMAGSAEGARTIVLTTEAAPAARRAAVARRADVVVAGRDTVSPAAAVAALAARGLRRVLVEGGPGLLGQITAAGLLDEVCVTVSPVLEGGHAGRILAPGGEGAVAGLGLAHVLEDHGFLLCRYLRATADTGRRQPRTRGRNPTPIA
jgi:riboflavin biosynthesis pyrimidine reductase